MMMFQRLNWRSCLRAILVFGPLAVPVQAQYLNQETRCVPCHKSDQLENNKFCRRSSADLWLSDDKHKRAFALLNEDETGDPIKTAAKRDLVKQILGFELKEAFVVGEKL